MSEIAVVDIYRRYKSGRGWRQLAATTLSTFAFVVAGTTSTAFAQDTAVNLCTPTLIRKQPRSARTSKVN